MNFSNLLDHFKTTMTKILDLEQPIQEYEVKKVSSILKTFAKCDMNNSDIKMFLDSVLIYFVFLNKYAQQFEIRSNQKHLHVRLALEVFLFVVDTQQIYNIIINKFAKVIDTILESDPLNYNVKEYLRIYSDILDQLSSDVAQKLAAKHKKIHIWYEVVKKTGDIETQAIIVSALLKLFKFHDFTVILKDIFPEITQVSSTNEETMYQNIRMVLDKINGSGTNIFSINCSTIEVDSLRVEEFNAAPGDIWLDFNLLEENISFFCSQCFFTSLTNLKPFLQTSWEVLSFNARDVLKVDFNYNKILKTLELSLKLRGSVFNVLCSPKFDTVCSVNISVSQYSERFNVLVEQVLPKFFPNVFSGDSPFLLSEKDSNSSITPDITLQSRSSSPVIHCFTMNRPKNSTSKEADLQNSLRECELESIVSIPDDDDDIMANEDGKRKNCICVKINDEETGGNKSKKRIGGMIETKTYASYEHRAQFNKSITPVSFTESLVRKRKKMSRRDSPSIEKMPSKEKKGRKISTSLSSPIVDVKSRVSKKGKRKPKLKDLIEVAREAHLEDILDTSEACSVSKVEDWLKSFDKCKASNGEIERETLEIPAFEEKIDLDPVEALSVSLSDISNKSIDDMQLVQEQISKSVDEIESPNRNKEVKIQEEKSTEIEKNLEEIQKSPVEITRINGAKIQEKSTVIKENIEEVTRITEAKEVDVSKQSLERNYESVIQEVEENLSKIFSEQDEAEIQTANQESEIHRTDDLLHILSSQKEKTPEIDKADSISSISSDGHNLKDSVFDKLKVLDPNNNNVNQSQEKYNISSSSDEEAIVEEKPKENVSDIKQDLNGTIRKRRLYSPGDLSYLKAQTNEEYLTSKSEVKPTPKPVRSRSKKPKTKNKKETAPKRRRRSSGTSTQKKPLITKEDIMKIKVVETDAISKMLDTLKQDLREQRKKSKAVKKKGKKAVQATSSSESMEPFGECLKMSRKRQSSSSHHTENEKKINIISNILIQPANSQNSPNPTVDKSNCYEQLVLFQGESFLKNLDIIEKSEPRLLQNEVFTKIFEKLQCSRI
ncbi:uncharacterized protein LOC103315202 isoform X2 [Tribolium castaneum]|uniref:uncharacterized protein LOC103315202 isoform X2 n=1 Tax=Tribolium castaneum TaxID=7070 RepID=UPI00046C3803|nr:PREDICTED: uncharacterized protein LOC103315202 isoform X2 [Tribolium castaneum]|eukprot:XP_008201505.1 PREDICTED: uncharacterized protein LOC103315202 isoform X2 [Tribolium castaneum]